MAYLVTFHWGWLVASLLLGLAMGWIAVVHRGQGVLYVYGNYAGDNMNFDIAAELATQGFEVDRRKIQLPEPLKSVGDFKVAVKLHREVTAQLKVKVLADAVEGAEAEAAAADVAAEAAAEPAVETAAAE